jgi:hypothetical protein
MWPKNIIHETLKRCWSVCQSEWHHHKLIVIVMSSKSGFWNIIMLDPDLVVTRAQVRF